MTSLSRNTEFFGNAVDASCRLADLEQYHEHMQMLLRREADYVSNLHVDLEIEYLPLFAETFPPIVHTSIIVSTVMLVEHEIQGYSKALKEALKLGLSLSDLRGSLLQRFGKYVNEVAHLSTDLNSVIWENMRGLFEVRNCIVHSLSHIDSKTNRKVITEYYGRHSLNVIWDDTLHIDDKAASIALESASNFFDCIFNLALTRFPGEYTWPMTFNRSRMAKAQPDDNEKSGTDN